MRMLFGLVFIASILTLSCWSYYVYDPTIEEHEKALAFQHIGGNWGDQAEQGNIRLMCLVDNDLFHSYYSTPLNKYLMTKSLHSEWNGSVETMFIRRSSLEYITEIQFPFESRPTSVWPNIFLLDFSINLFRFISADKVSGIIEEIISTINLRYSELNLRAPDYMFVEFFYARQCILFMETHGNATKEDKISLLNSSSVYNKDDLILGNVRGCPMCEGIRSVAVKHGYPIVSWWTLGYPAFLRYFLAESLDGGLYHLNPWKYTDNGLHINAAGGQFLVEKLFSPFFSDVMCRQKLLE